MTAPAAPPTTAPMMAPRAVDPEFSPLTPPAAPPAAAPITAPFSFRLIDAHALSERTAPASNSHMSVRRTCGLLRVADVAAVRLVMKRILLPQMGGCA